MVPVTPFGQFVGILCMLTGILVIALPVIIIGDNFAIVFRNYILEKEAKELKKKASKSIYYDDDLSDDYNNNNNKQDSKNKKKIIPIKQSYSNDEKLDEETQGFLSIYDKLIKINKKLKYKLFNEVDANQLFKNGINNEIIFEQLLLDQDGFAFYPIEMQKFKIFVLHEIYGQFFRDRIEKKLNNKNRDTLRETLHGLGLNGNINEHERIKSEYLSDNNIKSPQEINILLNDN